MIHVTLTPTLSGDNKSHEVGCYHIVTIVTLSTFDIKIIDLKITKSTKDNTFT